MKTYNIKDYNNFEELMNAMASELNDKLGATKVSGRFGDGTILSVGASTSNFGNGFIAYIEFKNEVKQIRLDIALKSGTIQMVFDKAELVNEFMTELNRLSEKQKELDIKAAEEQKAIREAAIEAEKEMAKRAKAEAKFEERKNATLAKLGELVKTKIVIGDNFYAALGWLAKNMTSITARMPDYCESWFRSQFGDVKATIVDSKKKTSGGFAAQWGLGLTLGIKASAKDNIPFALQKYMGEAANKNFGNTQFIFTLLNDYGFKIGTVKEQDVEEIRRYIPADSLDDFNAAYAA